MKQGKAQIEGVHTQIFQVEQNTKPSQQNWEYTEEYDENFEDYFSDDEEEPDISIIEIHNRLVLMNFCGFRFHIALELFREDKSNLPDLGKFDDLIDVKRSGNLSIGFNQAVDILSSSSK